MVAGMELFITSHSKRNGTSFCVFYARHRIDSQPKSIYIMAHRAIFMDRGLYYLRVNASRAYCQFTACRSVYYSML